MTYFTKCFENITSFYFLLETYYVNCYYPFDKLENYNSQRLNNFKILWEINVRLELIKRNYNKSTGKHPAAQEQKSVMLWSSKERYH